MTSLDTPFRIGCWTVKPADGMIENGNESRRLQPRVMALLCRFAATPDELLSREQLISDVWNGRAMSDEPLHRCIAELRAALGDDCNAPRFIETLPRRGYRTVAKVSPLPQASKARSHLGAAIYLLVIAAIAVSVFLAQQSEQSPPRLLVLPLDALSTDPAHALLADALTEELINALTRKTDAAVLSRTTSFGLGTTSAATHELRQRLDVDLLVEGSVRVVDEYLRISVQLIDAHTDRQLLSEVFSQPLSIASQTLEAVAQSVSQRLSDSMQVDVYRDVPAGTDFETWRQFIEGQHLWQSDDESDVRKAVVLLTMVVEQAPQLPAAHAHLAAAHLMLRNLVANGDQHTEKLQLHLQEALRLDAKQPLALSLHAIQRDDIEPARVLRLLDEAIKTDPAVARAHMWKMQLLYRAGYLDDAHELALYLHARNPLSAEVNGWLASLELDLSNHAEFEDLVRYAAAMGWQASDTLLFYHALRMADGERAALHLKRRWSQSTRVSESELQQIVDAILEPAGRPAAITLVEKLLANDRPITRYWGFVWLDLLGAHDKAIDLLLQDTHVRDSRVLYTIWGPAHYALRQHPRFIELIRHFRLDEVWRDHGDNAYCATSSEKITCR